MNSQGEIKEEKYWQKALKQSDSAVVNKSLIPLKTKVIRTYIEDNYKFELRELIQSNNLTLPQKNRNNTNPFLPWDQNLEIATISNQHVLILNKYPVQIGHMLLITKTWKPQNGWLEIEDFKALTKVDIDTTGLWFFNSGPKAGASQPHRHLQLLRRGSTDILCPRMQWYYDFIDDNLDKNDKLLKYINVVSRKKNSRYIAQDLYNSYTSMCLKLGIGSHAYDIKPRKEYNILISEDWIAIILRERDEYKGFNINALGFAGYLLATYKSDIHWLNTYGPSCLLRSTVGL